MVFVHIDDKKRALQGVGAVGSTRPGVCREWQKPLIKLVSEIF